jgi:hypothetical protein
MWKWGSYQQFFLALSTRSRVGRIDKYLCLWLVGFVDQLFVRQEISAPRRSSATLYTASADYVTTQVDRYVSR